MADSNIFLLGKQIQPTARLRWVCVRSCWARCFSMPSTLAETWTDIASPSVTELQSCAKCFFLKWQEVANAMRENREGKTTHKQPSGSGKAAGLRSVGKTKCVFLSTGLRDDMNCRKGWFLVEWMLTSTYLSTACFSCSTHLHGLPQRCASWVPGTHTARSFHEDRAVNKLHDLTSRMI